MRVSPSEPTLKWRVPSISPAISISRMARYIDDEALSSHAGEEDLDSASDELPRTSDKDFLVSDADD